MSRKYLEDCSVGETVVTPGRTITEADIVAFASFTGDWNPLHTNAEFARRTRFGERIAHGMLVLSVGTGPLMRMGDPGMLPESTVALYELEKVRFRAPTKIGDTIHAEGVVADTTEIDEARGLLTIKGAVKNQRGEAVVTFTVKALAGRRP